MRLHTVFQFVRAQRSWVFSIAMRYQPYCTFNLSTSALWRRYRVSRSIDNQACRGTSCSGKCPSFVDTSGRDVFAELNSTGLDLLKSGSTLRPVKGKAASIAMASLMYAIHADMIPAP